MSLLNPEQQKAVLKTEGPTLILAGAGSGKTKVVTERIGYLIEQGVLPSFILGLTFTNKAADEMKSRVKQRTEKDVWISTFHRFGAKILRDSGISLGISPFFTIFDEEDALKVIKNLLEKISTKTKKEPKIVRNYFSKIKNHLLFEKEQISKFLEEEDDVEMKELIPSLFFLYQEKLKEADAVDFDDLLFLPLLLFKKYPEILEAYQNKYRYLLVDEYQDTNPAQYALVEQLAKKHRNLFVVGDPDQSIYSWRGAVIGNILNFSKDYENAEIIYLEENYRSTETILKASNSLIEKNKERYPKNLWSTKGQGEPIVYMAAPSDRQEAAFIADIVQEFHFVHSIPYQNMAVFYRTNFQSRIFEDSLIHQRIPYRIFGGISFYQRKEVKDLLAFLRIVSSDKDFISFARTINLPKRGIGEASLFKLQEMATLEKLSIFKYVKTLVTDSSTLLFPVKLSKKQQASLLDYVTIIEALRGLKETLSLKDLLQEVISLTTYLDILLKDPDTFSDKKENIAELVSKAMAFGEEPSSETLPKFLEDLALKSEFDEKNEQEIDRLNLMTIHNSKGLEFDLVIMAGMEEDLFPHANSRGSFDLLEEERRLCYVGMTRARKFLFFTSAEYRLLWGAVQRQRKSRFLSEIPSHFMQTTTYR